MPLPSSSPPARLAHAAAAALTAGLVVCGAVPSPTAAAGTARTSAPAAQRAASWDAAQDRDPLTVQIELVSPAVVPVKGKITVSGTIVNDSDEQWRVIKLYPLTSSTPFTTPEELTAAAATSPQDYFGDRITDVDATVDVLDPGASASFSVSVARDDLSISGEPGVYWLGIHALGETDAGREEVPVADGRDRVFLPLLDPPVARRKRQPPPPQPTLDTALVIPVRHQVRYAADGSVDDPDGWAADLEPRGALGRLGSLATAGGSRPVTWLVDPAVTDAVSRLGRDNPGRSLADTLARGGDGEPSASPSDLASPAAGEASGTDPAADPGAAEGDSADGTSGRVVLPAATGWLARLKTALRGGEVLGLPYGDLDVAAAAESDRGLYRMARQRSGRSDPVLDLRTTPVVAPPGGLLDEAGFGIVPPKTTILVSDTLLDEETRADAPAVVRLFGHRAYVSNTAVLAGSGRRQDSFLDVRQRLLAESLVRLLSKRGPLVATIPTDDPDWLGGSASALFVALDQAPWVRLTTLSGLSDRRAKPLTDSQTRYPLRVQNLELKGDVLTGARQLIARGRLLDAILPLNDTVAAQVEDEALTTVSYADRDDPFAARRDADAARRWIDDTLSKITVETPPSVTLSSAEGRLSADIVNGLDQTVRVRIQAQTDPGLEITPTPVQDLGPGERATLQMEATATNLAVHSVELVVADESGTPVGTAATFPLRANQVSQVIWVVIGVGALLLFTTIGIRLVRRIRRGLAQRRTPGVPG